MNKLLTAVALVPLLIAAPALAADFNEPEVFVDEPVDTGSVWDGFYTGIHIGGGIGNRFGCVTDDDEAPEGCFEEDPPGFDFDYDLRGLLLGTQAGFNFALTESFIVGVEVSSSFTNISGFLEPDDPGDGEGSYNWIHTGTARLGWGNDMFLLYGEGGVALAGFQFESSPFSCNFETTALGGVAGLGAEVMVAGNVSVFAEWNRIFLKPQDNNCNNLFNDDLTAHTAGHLDLFKAGLNAHF
jgi:outer membrane immunogenic protein